MSDILNIAFQPTFDERIIKIESHTYNPYTSSKYDNNDEIRIPIHQQDLYTLPSESFLNIEGQLIWKNQQSSSSSSQPTTSDIVKLTNNCAASLFDEIRYELNGVVIDQNRYPGITSTLKNYVSLNMEKAKALQSASWDITSTKLKDEFNFCVPLNMLLGFCEDYKSIVINARHELVLKRSGSDNNCILAQADGLYAKIVLYKIQWRMPHVLLNDVTKLSLLKTLQSGKFLSMSFRSWDLYDFPLLQSTTKHSWTIKTAVQLEKPRYVIFALQTGRKNNVKENVTMFDHCNLTNVKLFLNSDVYPYDDMNLNLIKTIMRYSIICIVISVNHTMEKTMFI